MGDQGRKGAAAAAATAADDGTIRLLMLCSPGNPLKAAAPVGIRSCSGAKPELELVFVGTVVLAVLKTLADRSRSLSRSSRSRSRSRSFSRSSEGVEVRRGRLGVAGEEGLTVIALCGEAGKLPALPRPLLLSRSRSRSRFEGVLSRDVAEVVISLGEIGEPLFDLRRCDAGGGVGGLLRFSATLELFSLIEARQKK